MPMEKIVIAHLRRPRKKDTRDDPFWEFGSFGLTGCHADNLLHHTNVHALDGRRLAFAQGGKQGFKLVFLTPPISIVEHTKYCEATWKPGMRPFKYDDAPVLVANNGQMMGGMKEALQGVDRTTLEAKFSSRFRSRKEPLNDDFPELAEQIAAQFDSRYGKAKREGTLARTYDQALPWPINCPDRKRNVTHHNKLDEAGGVLAPRDWRPCRPRKRC
jgi:hypothetical protein